MILRRLTMPLNKPSNALLILKAKYITSTPTYPLTAFKLRPHNTFYRPYPQEHPEVVLIIMAFRDHPCLEAPEPLSRLAPMHMHVDHFTSHCMLISVWLFGWGYILVCLKTCVSLKHKTTSVQVHVAQLGPCCLSALCL